MSIEKQVMFINFHLEGKKMKVQMREQKYYYLNINKNGENIFKLAFSHPHLFPYYSNPIIYHPSKYLE